MKKSEFGWPQLPCNRWLLPTLKSKWSSFRYSTLGPHRTSLFSGEQENCQGEGFAVRVASLDAAALEDVIATGQCFLRLHWSLANIRHGPYHFVPVLQPTCMMVPMALLLLLRPLYFN